ncbi:MAG TPA: hypothetical protein VE011_10440 [Candidatus Dormibacteraeota bacterium]|nr:hypothetical protein [Candidatus Dormibacteraeota bacterium]
MREVNAKLRKAIDAEGRLSRLEGDWWQLIARRLREWKAIASS